MDNHRGNEPRRGRRYWFPAKPSGLGWGPPATWQGWVVLLAFIALVVVDGFVVLDRYGETAFLVVLAILVAALLLICWRTGEPLGRHAGSK